MCFPTIICMTICTLWDNYVSIFSSNEAIEYQILHLHGSVYLSTKFWDGDTQQVLLSGAE